MITSKDGLESTDDGMILSLLSNNSLCVIVISGLPI